MASMTPNRIMFWQIDHVWSFYVLADLATGLFLAGLGAHIWVWKRSAKSPEISFSGGALNRTILDAFLGRRVFQGDVAGGLKEPFRVMDLNELVLQALEN